MFYLLLKEGFSVKAGIVPAQLRRALFFDFFSCHILTCEFDLKFSRKDYIMKKNKIILTTNTIAIIMTIIKTLEIKDTYTKEHSIRVADYALLLAEKLGMSKEEINDIYVMALLHDVGKIRISDNILKKSGKLTEEELKIIQKHTIIGENIIKSIPYIQNAAAGARYHHEYFNGKGYPDGLKGEEIPIEARIIAVADAFDAMTNDRVYKKKVDLETAKNEIIRGSNTQFDPYIAKNMLELINSEKLSSEKCRLLLKI